MTKELWINQPVKDVAKSTEFFTGLGFSLNEEHGKSDQSACLLIGGKNIVVMLFAESMFKTFIKNEISDPAQGGEVLFSFDAESPFEVDELAEKARKGGATIISEPADIQGWMYGFVFADPDGHRWNVLYMDMSRMPKG